LDTFGSTWYDMLELPSGTLIGTTQGNSGLSTLRSIDGGLSWDVVLTGSNMMLKYFQGGRLVAIKSGNYTAAFGGIGMRAIAATAWKTGCPFLMVVSIIDRRIQ